MTDAERFIVAGRDLETFITTWFEDLRSGGGESRDLIDNFENMEMLFLMANIARRAAQPDASDEELLLFSALAVAREYFREERMEPVIAGWGGMWKYICDAFDYLHEVGNEEAALILVKSVLRGMQTQSEEEQFLRSVWSNKEPGERAAHERYIAEIKQRELRAARLLDPTVDVDAVMLSMPPNERDADRPM